jgi:hypothetical protein
MIEQLKADLLKAKTSDDLLDRDGNIKNDIGEIVISPP